MRFSILFLTETVCFLICTHVHTYLTTFFFFNDTATTEIYTLSLHDALPISPLHRKFQSPLQSSSTAVSNAVSELSSEISHPTYRAAYAPFTPNESEQRLGPLYYRGCWHRVSRPFLFGYYQYTRS